MRHSLRRILWIVPTLFVISLGSFWLLSGGAGWQASRVADDDPFEHPLFGPHRQPRFFNRAPHSVADLARAAMTSIAADDEHADAAKRELTRLGGAALPWVLPALDTLDPKERARVALALAPLGERMGVGSGEELGSAESAVLFWTRFWQDRAIEFRPAVAARAVERLGERMTAGRRDDVRQLDTYALSNLMAGLGPLRDAEDLKRVRRLVAAAAEITGRPWTLPKDATLADAREVASRWQAFWLEHHADYVTFDGVGRVLAMVSETEYGRWAASAAQNRLGVSAGGRTVLDLLLERAPVTLGLVLSALFGGYVGGILVGLLGAARPRGVPDLLGSAAAVGVAAMPVVLLATLLGGANAPRAQLGVGLLVMVAASGAVVSRHQRVATRVALDQEYTRTARAFGAGPWRLARRSFRASSVAAVSLLGVDLATQITAAFVVEHALGLHGLAGVTLAAVSARDAAWMMALSLGVATSIALAQILSDGLLAALDPRVRVGLARKRGALE
jgi:peptide/nickel transport system permease protein